MKKYIGKKSVEAEPMTLGEYINRFGRNPYEDGDMHGNNEVGYLVKYEDGYESWSPQGVFEKVYKPADTFIDRLMVEYDELENKFKKLTEFISTKTFEDLDKAEQSLLLQQHKCILTYTNILHKRMLLLNK